MDLSRLGARIKQAREKLRLRQLDLAAALRVSSQAVSKWERGENAPDITLLVSLSRLLGVSVEWILEGNQAEPGTFSATVFATSLFGFAARAARTPPRELAAWANVIHYAVTEAVLKADGIPVKCVGDGFLAFFSGAEQARRAVAAACHAKRICETRDLVIVLHRGPIYLGAVGHPDYARTDIIGATVNTTFLLMPFVSEHCTTPIGMTDTVAKELGEDLELLPCGEATVRGISSPVAVYTPAPHDMERSLADAPR